MLNLIIIILLIAVLAKLQTINAAQKKTHAQDTRMEIDLFKVNQTLKIIEHNMRAFIFAFNTANDTGAAFNTLREKTTDEALRSVAIAAALFAQPGNLKEVKAKKGNGKNSH